MTKKDYERAASIAQLWADGDTDLTPMQIVEEAFVKLFRVDANPRFDEARFRAACVLGARVNARARKVTA